MSDMNILPPAKGRADAPSEDYQKLSSWQPEKADPRDPRNVPFGLGVDTSDDVFKPVYLKNEPPVADPNHRDTKESYYDPSTDPSPLSAIERGSTEKPTISMPKVDLSMSMSATSLKAAHVPKEMPLWINIINLHKSCIDLFLQRAGRMFTSGMSCVVCRMSA